MKFSAQGGEIAPTRRVEKHAAIRRLRDADAVAADQLGIALHVEVHAHVARRDHLDHDIGAARQHDGAVRQGMRRNRHQHHTVHAGVQNGPVGRQRIGRGARRRGDDQAVCPLHVHEAPVHLHLQLHQPRRAVAIDHHIIHRNGAENGLPRTLHRAAEHGALLALEVAGHQTVDRGLPLAVGDIGHEAQPPGVDAHQRHIQRSEPARRAQHGAVAAQHHRHPTALRGALGQFAAAQHRVRQLGVLRGKLAHPDLHSGPAQPRGNLAKFALRLRRLILADQQDLLEHGTGHGVQSGGTAENTALAANYSTGASPA